MQKIGDDILFSATDLVNFLECEHLTHLDLIDLVQPLPRTPDDEEAQVFQDRGIEHERLYLQSLADSGLQVADLSGVRGNAQEKASVTADAIRNGIDIVYQGTLFNGNFVGYPGFLRKLPSKQGTGIHFYEVVDTKLARTPKASHIVQLSFYSELLSVAQGDAPRLMHLVLGDRSEVNFRCDQYRQYYRNLVQRFRHRISEDCVNGTYPEMCNHCGFCRWRGLCEETWHQDDHLNQIANITRLQIKKLRASGIHTLEALAKHRESKPIPKLNQQILVKLQRQASLQLKKRMTGHDSHELLELDPDCKRGFYRMPRPDPGDLFFDMEGDPLEDGGLEYLFGVYYHYERGEPAYRHFLAHTRDEERQAFEKFMDFVGERLVEYPSAHIYHYANYEEAALKRLMSFHGARENQVDDLLRNHKLVDLYKVVRESIRTSEPEYSIKNLETFYGHKRSGEVKNAATSLVYYEKWLQTKDKKYIEQIIDYNSEDCRSTYLLREWLVGLKPIAVPWMKESGEDSKSNRQSKSEAQLSMEQQLEVYQAKLLGNDEMGHEEKALRELVFYLLNFHRRVDKPEWWAIFSRRDMTEEELIDDSECIGGMVMERVLPNASGKGRDLWLYRYPNRSSSSRKEMNALPRTHR